MNVGKALDKALTKAFSEHPVTVIGVHLLHSQGISTKRINCHPETPHPLELDINWSAKQAVDTQRDIQKKAPSRPSSPPPPDTNAPQWNLSAWLASLELDGVVAEAIRAPLENELQDSESNHGSQTEVEHSFVTTLGDLSSVEPIKRLLQDQNVLESIAEKLWASAKQLRTVQGEAGHGEGMGGAASKFFEDGTKALKFGELSTFYKGLDVFLGPPNPNLREAMENEHCNASDSQIKFRVPNYHTLTTPRLEYWFVTDPSDEKLREVEGEEATFWPHEERLFGGGKAEYSDFLKAQRAVESGGPSAEAFRNDRADPTNPQRIARKALPPSHFEAELHERNGQLRDKGMEALLEEELIGGRMYTGPMYCKYNVVLRDIGEVQSSLQSTNSSNSSNVSEDEISNRIRKHQERKDGPDMESKMAHRTEGNLYTTTLHVINSCVLKLGKLARAGMVYRGLNKKAMPNNLKYKDTVSNVRGGVEFGFTSCSTEKTEALLYAKQGPESQTPILLEIQEGMVDRGADLSWLSQYPHEKEGMHLEATRIQLLASPPLIAGRLALAS